MTLNKGYYKTEVEFDRNGEENRDYRMTERGERDVKAYVYEDAINMSGIGWYSVLVVTTMSISLTSMCVDMFGYSVTVGGSRCEFGLDMSQNSALLTMPFFGAVTTSYLWGYLSDTRGRRYCLIIGMWSSFVVSSLSAFSPHYVVSGLLKFISTGLCCSAQATTFVMLGECCPQRARAPFMLVMTGLLNLTFIIYIVPAYYILNTNFVLNVLGFAIQPWRMLTLALALPLGISATLLHFMYESPKFLANAGRKHEALAALAKIWKKNGNKGEYPVEKLIFNEDCNITRRDMPILKSLWQQTAPLFRPPLVYRTFQMYYILGIIYSISSSIVVWFPFMAEAFFNLLNSSTVDGDGSQDSFCNIIDGAHDVNGTEDITCSVEIKINTVYLGLGQGSTCLVILLCTLVFASRKKAMTLVMLLGGGLSALGAVLLQNSLANFFSLFGVLSTSLCVSCVYAYFVDLYPTSYRGMVSCLGTIVARISGLIGVKVLGAYVMSHCSLTFYACSACMFSALIVSIFLPSDRPKMKIIT